MKGRSSRSERRSRRRQNLTKAGLGSFESDTLGRLQSARSGHSPRVWRRGQVDQKRTVNAHGDWPYRKARRLWRAGSGKLHQRCDGVMRHTNLAPIRANLGLSFPDAGRRHWSDASTSQQLTGSKCRPFCLVSQRNASQKKFCRGGDSYRRPIRLEGTLSEAWSPNTDAGSQPYHGASVTYRKKPCFLERLASGMSL